MGTFITFETTQAARDHRHSFGTGGWIFASDDRKIIILFPPDMSPSSIFNHQLTKGLSGDLIGNG
jgi:hypothetical protein